MSSGLLSFFTTGGDFFMWSYFRDSASHRSRCWSRVARTSANLVDSGMQEEMLIYRQKGSILQTMIHAMVRPRLWSNNQGAAQPLAGRPCSTSLGDGLPGTGCESGQLHKDHHPYHVHCCEMSCWSPMDYDHIIHHRVLTPAT